MVQRVQTILVDDFEDKEIPGGQGETVTFALDGASYEIDLSDKNADRLRKAFAFYTDQCRCVGGRRSTSASTAARPAAKDYDTRAVKAWAVGNGVDVPVGGRILDAVIEQYQAAGN